ncbi:Inositol 1,4,5-trisphosphate receptor type 3 [Manis javanica]|nr:Inositol 1,4,5-trisphosphate receptor type 3 [Manis javanica]
MTLRHGKLVTQLMTTFSPALTQKNVELLISVTFAKDGETDLKGYINIILDNDRVHVLVKKSKLFGDMKVDGKM